MSYKERIRWHLKEFCYKTSSHGIPMLGQAPNTLYRCTWIVLLLCCAGMFIFQALKFFNEAMRNAALKTRNRSLGLDSKDESKLKKRGAGFAKFEPAHSVCSCVEEEDDGMLQCEAEVTVVPKDDNYCLCAFDRDSDDAWPCYPKVTEILKLWVYYGDALQDKALIAEALGFQNMTDEVAIVTKAKENIIFAMSQFSDEQRIKLSIQKRQLIQKCSFNGAECNIDKDFIVVADPTFGNCYTFNFNRTENKSSIRAGPMYGLRLLVYVNASDYLPTTEAVGIRITIHDKDEYPFPDTFGYSAPTGYISSFGMKLKKMTRLPAPFGDCVPDGLTTSYIYEDFRYSTEGCYRTCFQEIVLRDCGCGDPRFPVPSNALHCSVFDPEARKCLERRTNELSDIHSSFRCLCQQPCSQSVYTVSYSAAIWPSESLNVSIGNCNSEPDVCIEHYKENGAMVEVFYEALNFEMLTESEAYGVVKMLSDFGGQLGLWSGVSFITCCEFVFLIFETIYMVVDHHYRKYKRKKEHDDLGE
ncbi:unnamed protein product [Anisakis simplex]|uniref:Uncharacterized protein n=1 Tax=Anisakis simplex TaxID=6269 RepID=A0A3P6Q4Z6_ANISI|nr:unnamed protein product [Anisakis simplex]